MKETRMPPVQSANLVANNGSTIYGVSVITSAQVPWFRKWRRENVAHETYLPLAGGQQH